jgi:hypothetical protein
VATVTATADQTYGAVLLVGDTTTAADTFTRTVANGWGTSDTGQVWTTSGGVAGDYAVATGTGNHTQTSTNVARKTVLAALALTDQDEVITVTVPAVATVAALDAGLMLRYVDASNHYVVELSFGLLGVATLRIDTVIAGVTTLGVATYTMPTAYTATSVWTIRARVVGTTISGKAWLTSTAEPTAWLVTATNGSLTAASAVGVRTIAETGNTNGAVVFKFDQYLTPGDVSVAINRVTPDGVSTPVRGTPILSSGNSVVLWDDEAPLNTALTYTMTTIETVVSTSSVSITGGGGEIGWIKDPLNPGLDVPLLFFPKTDGCRTTPGVGLLSLDSEVFADNAGEYGLIANPRPIVLGQIRDDAASALRFMTITQANYLALKTVLASGNILLIQLPVAYGWAVDRYGSDYVHVKDVTVKRPTSASYKKAEREWSMPYTLSGAPANAPTGTTGDTTVGVGRSTWGAMKATGLTWAALKATGKTNAQIAQGQGY